MTTATIIVAAGRGTRAGGPKPKQWQQINGRMVADWTIDLFLPYGPVVLVINPDDTDIADTLKARDQIMLASGASERAGSVRAGLEQLTSVQPDKVLIHDVARPCTPNTVINGVLAALETGKAAAPALPVTDALWMGENGFVTGTRDRTGLFRAQTPQGFDYQTILSAHQNHPGTAADDVEVARAAGIEVAITQGSDLNLKITAPEDFDRAARILEELYGSATG